MAEEKRIPVPKTGLPRAFPRKITRKEAVEKAEAFAARNLPKYLKVLENLAFGIWTEEIIDGEHRMVYQKAPSREAAQYLIDRGMGKAPQRYEVTGEEGGPMQFAAWAPSAKPALPEPEEGDTIDAEFTDISELPEGEPSLVSLEGNEGEQAEEAVEETEAES